MFETRLRGEKGSDPGLADQARTRQDYIQRLPRSGFQSRRMRSFRSAQHPRFHETVKPRLFEIIARSGHLVPA